MSELSTSHGDLVADAVVTGTASDLMLTLWGRTDLSTAQVEGERTALGWVLALGAKDGSMQLTVTGEGVTFVGVGECLLDN